MTRNKALRVLSQKKRDHFYNLHIGKSRKVLIEEHEKKGRLFGFTDNYIKIDVKASDHIINTIQEVSIGPLQESGSCKSELLRTIEV